MNFAFSFSGSIQEERQQDPPKMEVFNGHNGLSKAKNCEPSKEETRGDLKWAKVLLSRSSSLSPFFMPLHLLRLPPVLLLPFFFRLIFLSPRFRIPPAFFLTKCSVRIRIRNSDLKNISVVVISFHFNPSRSFLPPPLNHSPSHIIFFSLLIFLSPRFSFALNSYFIADIPFHDPLIFLGFPLSLSLPKSRF